MKRLISILLFLFLCVYVWSADQVVNLAGTWILDVKNSDPFFHPLPNLGAPAMGGSEGAGARDAGGGGRGGTPASRDATANMPPGDMGRGGAPGFGRGPQSATPPVPMIIEQNGTDLKVTRVSRIAGKEVPVIETYILDGAEHTQTTQVPGSPDPVKVVVSAKPKKNSVQIRMLLDNPKNKTEVRREFSLSKDGKTLTVKHSNKTQVGGEMIQDQVYRKAE